MCSIVMLCALLSCCVSTAIDMNMSVSLMDMDCMCSIPTVVRECLLGESYWIGLGDRL